jgi:hypothetical protein
MRSCRYFGGRSAGRAISRCVAPPPPRTMPPTTTQSSRAPTEAAAWSRWPLPATALLDESGGDRHLAGPSLGTRPDGLRKRDEPRRARRRQMSHTTRHECTGEVGRRSQRLVAGARTNGAGLHAGRLKGPADRPASCRSCRCLAGQRRAGSDRTGILVGRSALKEPLVGGDDCCQRRRTVVGSVERDRAGPDSSRLRSGDVPRRTSSAFALLVCAGETAEHSTQRAEDRPRLRRSRARLGQQQRNLH